MGRRTLLTSSDGLEWELRPSGAAGAPVITGITWHQGRFLALESRVETPGQPQLWESVDGSEWQPVGPITTVTIIGSRPTLRDLAASAAGDLLIVGGDLPACTLSTGSCPYPFTPFPPSRNIVLQGADPTIWQADVEDESFYLTAVAAGEESDVAVGTHGTILRRGEPAAGPPACEPGPGVLCLQEGRFQVEAAWCDPFGDVGCGHGRAVPLTEETGTFWFFNEENLELMVKVLDGRAFNDRFWVFWGALSDVEYWITVEDTATGAEQVYYNAPAELASGKDMEAFQ